MRISIFFLSTKRVVLLDPIPGFSRGGRPPKADAVTISFHRPRRNNTASELTYTYGLIGLSPIILQQRNRKLLSANATEASWAGPTQKVQSSPATNDSHSSGDLKTHLWKWGLQRICHWDTVTPISHFVVNKTSPASSLAQGPDLTYFKSSS